MNYKKTYSFRLIILITLITAFFAAIIAAKSSVNTARADTDENRFTVNQIKKITYLGEDLLKNDVNKKIVFDAFEFKIDNELISVNLEDCNIISDKSIDKPSTYYLGFEINYNDKKYTANDVELVVDKRQVTIYTLLNGETDLKIAEGEDITIEYDYEGAFEGDTEDGEAINGRKITTLKTSVLQRPPFVEYSFEDVTERTAIIPSYAYSDYYDFIYATSYVTITRSPVKNLEVKEEDVVTVSVSGDFGIRNTLFFENIGTSKQSVEYTEIYTKINSIYGSNDILTDFESIECYDIALLKNEEKVLEPNASLIKVKLGKNSTNRKAYKVIALYNNGDSEILSCQLTEDREYLVFAASDFGSFVVMGAVEGPNILTYIIAIFSGILVILIVVTFVSLFRKKY